MKEEILIGIVAGLIATFLVAIISFVFKPVKKFFLKILGYELGPKYYIAKNKNKIYIFPKKQETRVSVSVLARIEKDGKFLLKSKTPELIRQDAAYKPFGGVVKRSKNMEEILNKIGFRGDRETRYSAKDKDFRIFINLNNNKIIHKAISSEKLTYYQNELIREVMEEMRISRKVFDQLFSFKKQQPISIHPHYTNPIFSALKHHDYVHHIIFDLKIKNVKQLEKKVSSNPKLKWVSLNGPEIKTITSHLLDERNNFKKLKKQLTIQLKNKKITKAIIFMSLRVPRKQKVKIKKH